MNARNERDPGIPWRVVGIAAGLLIVFAALVWWASSPAGDDGAGPTAATDPTGQGAPTAPGAGEAESGEPGVEGEVAGDETDAASTPPGVPPSEDAPPGAAGQAGPQDPDDPASLAALAPARAVRGSMTVQLFLVRPRLERLVPVTLELDAPDTLAAQVERAVEELIAWEGSEMTSPLPPETVVHDVFVSPARIAYVDFAGSLPDALGGGSLAELHAVYGVVTSITETFPEIRAVQILVEHRQADTLNGHVDVSVPLTPSSEWVMREPRGSRPGR